jgi:hypothetical protein
MIKLVSNDINNVKIIVNKVEYSITKITTWLGTPLQEFTIWDAGGSAGHTHTISSTGSSLSSSFDITPASIAAYCWKRTA